MNYYHWGVAAMELESETMHKWVGQVDIQMLTRKGWYSRHFLQ